MHIRMLVIKTWCAGWTTSHRMHESKLHECLFGCRGEQDNIAYYLRCPYLWDTLDRVVLGEASSRPRAGIAPLHRLGMFPPDQGAMQSLALAFSVYHAIKNQSSHLLEHAFASQDFSFIHATTQKLASMYAHDLGIINFPSSASKSSGLGSGRMPSLTNH